ncbi:MAG: hypothetical protein ABIY52_12950 [Gemmatimonadaceae bacterium]
MRLVLFLFLFLASSAVQAQALDTATTLGALREAGAACRADAGALWGRSLCGPIALADRQTRLVIANDSAFRRGFLPYGDAFVTSAPPGTGFANTSFRWADREWAMIMLPLPTDRFDRIALVMHEVFHREQAALLLAGQDPPNNQLDQRDGRRWLRLELHALAAALDALPGDDRGARANAADALVFRAMRRVLYPLADSLEPMLEMQEGLAEYSGVTLAMRATGESPGRGARRIRAFQSSPTYVRSFAYATGPALGILLDRFADGWRIQVRTTKDPARLLARAIAFTPPADLARAAERAAARHDVARIDREEAARDSVRRPMLAAYRARLVDGPALTFEQSSLNRNFDPSSLIGFDMLNTLYPTGTFSAEWGTLEVAAGVLVSNDYRQLTVAAPPTPPGADNRVIKGDGWSLTLSPGWAVVRDGAKAGSYRVHHVP